SAPAFAEYREALANALTDLAEAQRAAGRPAEAVATLTQLGKLWPGHPVRLFETARQLARCLPAFGQGAQEPAEERTARDGAADLAMATLTQAVVAGQPVDASFRRDPALAPLAQRPDFRALLATIDIHSRFAAPTGQVRRLPGHTSAWVEAVVFSA